MLTIHTDRAGRGRSAIRFAVLLLMAILLLQAVAGCGTAAQNTSQAQATQSPSTPSGQQDGKTYGPQLPSPTPTAQAALQGPTNFVLRDPLNFSNVGGTTEFEGEQPTPIAQDTVKAEMTEQMKHLLFVVAGDGAVSVYQQGSTTPLKVYVTPHSDRSTSIYYSQMTNSEQGSLTVTFDGLLSTDRKQVRVTYQQQFSALLTSDGKSSNILVSFTAQVLWVSADQIPTAPKSGAYTFTSGGAISLSWAPGQNAVAYNVYRLLPDQDSRFQLVSTVKGTSYSDSSAEALQQAHSKSGVVYAVFSVGPTGVENPAYAAIQVAAK